MTEPENPILYRAAREGRKAAPWQQVALRLLYPALVLVPAALLAAGAPRHHGEMLRLGFTMSAFLALAWFPLRALLGTASAFTHERELRTLEGLLASRLSPGELLGGKLAAGLRPLLADFLVGLLLWVPFLLVDAATVKQLVALHGLLVVCTLFAGMLGVWCSLRERSSLAAGGLALGAVAGLAVAGPLLDLVLGLAGLQDGLSVSVSSPPVVLLLALNPGCLPHAGFLTLEVAVLLYSVATALLWHLCLARLRGLSARPPGSASRAGRSPFLAWLARAWDNPVWFRHVLATGVEGSAAGRRLRQVLVPALLVGPTLLAWLSNTHGDFHVRLSLALEVGWLFTSLGLALLFSWRALSAGCRALALERERRTLEPLLGSPTGQGDLLLGLLAVVLGLPTLELLAWTPALALFAISDRVGHCQVGALVGVILALIMLCGTLGLWLSTAAPNPAQAIRRGIGLMTLLTLGTLLVDVGLNLVFPLNGFFLSLRANPLMGVLSAAFGPAIGLGRLWLWCISAYLLVTAFLVRATARWLREGGPSVS